MCTSGKIRLLAQQHNTVCLPVTDFFKQRNFTNGADISNSFSYSHQSKVKADAEGMRNMAYTALKCNSVINMTFLHTIILAGFGPSFSLYVESNSSSLIGSGRTSPFLDLCCFFSNGSVSVIVAVVR